MTARESGAGQTRCRSIGHVLCILRCHGTWRERAKIETAGCLGLSMTDSWALSGAVMAARTIRAGGASETNEDKSDALAATATQKEEQGRGRRDNGGEGRTGRVAMTLAEAEADKRRIEQSMNLSVWAAPEGPRERTGGIRFSGKEGRICCGRI